MNRAPHPPSDPFDADFFHWYGPWEPLTPARVAEELRGLTVPWWIVGGWAVDAWTGGVREHEDIDVAFFRDDLAAVLGHLLPTWCVWSNLSGTLRPLHAPEALLEGARQLWVRRDGASPWAFDLAITPHEGETWISPRDARVRMPLGQATFEGSDGIRYLRPELVLFMKARLARPKDEGDLERALPTLGDEARTRLRAWIETAHPGHAWLGRIERGAGPPEAGRREARGQGAAEGPPAPRS